jgi:hypothetical protein
LAAVWEGRGEMWKKKNRERECRRRGGYIMAFTDGITDGLIPSVIPSAIVPRHYTAISVWILW